MAFGHWPYWRQIPMFFVGELPSFPVLRLRNIATQQCVQTLKGHRTYITAATWHLEGIRKHHAIMHWLVVRNWRNSILTQCSFHMFEVIQKDKSIQRWKSWRKLQLHVVPQRRLFLEIALSYLLLHGIVVPSFGRCKPSERQGQLGRNRTSETQKTWAPNQN